MSADPSVSAGSTEEREEVYAVSAYDSAEDAFNEVVARLREARETLVGTIEEDISLEASADRVVLHCGDEKLAEAAYETMTGRESDVKGYRVRIRRQYKVHTKYFSDRRLGGRVGALRAAQYWRDLRKGRRPEGRTSPVPDDLILEEKADNYGRAAVERSQFGVPRMSVEIRTMESGNIIPYLKASWPTSEGGSRHRYVSLDNLHVEEATKEVCLTLVHARRSSDLTPDEIGQRATPFDILDGWFAESDLSPKAEANVLYEAIFPAVKQRAREALLEWRRRKRGLPGVDIRVKKNDSGRYAPFIRARWRTPSGTSVDRETEIRGEAVEAAFKRLAIDLVQYYQEAPESSELQENSQTPFSVLDSELRTSDECVERMVNIGLPAAVQTFKQLRQGLSGLRLSRRKEDPDSSPPGRGRPRKRYTLLLTWPTEEGARRRQKSFNEESEMEKALEIVIRRALEQIRKRSPGNVQAAVGAGSPFDGINPDSLQSSEGLKRATRRIVRNALPGLRLEFERLTS
jgi:hypothetical protein